MQEISLYKKKDNHRPDIDPIQLSKMLQLLDENSFMKLHDQGLKSKKKMIDGDQQFALSVKAVHSYQRMMK